jgi:hypothetical protein
MTVILLMRNGARKNWGGCLNVTVAFFLLAAACADVDADLEHADDLELDPHVLSWLDQPHDNRNVLNQPSETRNRKDGTLCGCSRCSSECAGSGHCDGCGGGKLISQGGGGK